MGKERRKKKRVPFKSNASIVHSGGKYYAGSTQNVSEEGLEYLLTSLPDVSSDFIPEKEIDMVMYDPSGKQYKLYCEVKWYLRGNDSDSPLTLGMKIMDPPPRYKELISTLTNEKDKPS